MGKTPSERIPANASIRTPNWAGRRSGFSIQGSEPLAAKPAGVAVSSQCLTRDAAMVTASSSVLSGGSPT